MSSSTDSHLSATAELMRALSAALPAEIAEVLLPALRLRAGPGRMVAVLPNPVWRDVFRDHAGEHARRALRARGLELQLTCPQDDAGAAAAGERRFESFLDDP